MSTLSITNMVFTNPAPNVHVAASLVQHSMIRCLGYYRYALTCYSEFSTMFCVALLAHFNVNDAYILLSLLFHNAATITERIRTHAFAMST